MPCLASTGSSASMSARTSGCSMAARSRRRWLSSIAGESIRVDRPYVRAYDKHMHTITDDIVRLDARAVAASVDPVARARPADMARPTPCADWTLHGLITHMAAQHHGFAAAAAGDADLARWRPRRLGDPAADYRAAAET